MITTIAPLSVLNNRNHAHMLIGTLPGLSTVAPEQCREREPARARTGRGDGQTANIALGILRHRTGPSPLASLSVPEATAAPPFDPNDISFHFSNGLDKSSAHSNLPFTVPFSCLFLPPVDEPRFFQLTGTESWAHESATYEFGQFWVLAPFLGSNVAAM